MKSESEANTGRVQATDTGKVSEMSELIRLGEQPDIKPAEKEVTGAPDEPPPEGEQPVPDDDNPEPPSIDYDLVIPISASDGEGEGGESQTISQLKDHYQATKSFESDREAWETRQTEQENEAMVARLHLNSLAEMLGDVAPEALQKARENLGMNAEHEARMILQVFPDWEKPEVKKVASEMMLATAREYGFTEAQYMAIDDHRQIKVLHDLAKFQKQARAGREKLDAAPKPPIAQKPAKPTPTPQPAVSSKTRIGSHPNQLAAIGALIEKAESSDGKPSR